MQNSMNILWQKAKKNDAYCDIFIGGGLDLTVNLKGTVHAMFEESKSPAHHKNDALSEFKRHTGKPFFEQRKYIEAMHVFNKCISLAPNESEQLGLAYSNRSLCFLQLKMPEECLVDIGLAKKSNYPEDMLAKLDARAAKCTTMLIDEKFRKSRFIRRQPQLSFDEHPDFKGVANCLDIRKTVKYGRHVVTTRDLKVGETILLEQPYAIIPKRFGDSPRDRCGYCYKECMNFIVCKNCVGSVRFCNDSCMNKSYHKYECKMPITLSRKETFELVLRMFFKISAAFPDVNVLIRTVETLLKGEEPTDLTSAEQKDFCSLFQLVHHHRQQEESHLTRLRAATDVIIITISRFSEFKWKFQSFKNRRFLQHLILHLFHIAEHAVMLHEYYQDGETKPISEHLFRQYASGMYPVGCFINHSCVPNVWCYSVDDRLICKVIRPIKRGEQVFRSYFPGHYSLLDRESTKENLETWYHFKCDCFVCLKKNWKPSSDTSGLINDSLYNEHVNLMEMTVKQFRKQPQQSIELFEKNAIEFLEKNDRFHPVHDTFGVQGSLSTIWNLLSSRY